MKVKLEFNDVNSEAEEKLSNFLVGVVDDILSKDIIKMCINIVHDVYDDYEDKINCTNKKKFVDFVKLLYKLDAMEKDK